jgi:hypothetical protein
MALPAFCWIGARTGMFRFPPDLLLTADCNAPTMAGSSMHPEHVSLPPGSEQGQ